MGSSEISHGRPASEGPDPSSAGGQTPEPESLSAVVSAPPWLRRLGQSSWLLVGVALLLGALIWIASLTAVIIVPMIVAAIVATVVSPIVSRLERTGIGRGIGTAIVLLVFTVLSVLLAVVILWGIVGEAGSIGKELTGAVDEIGRGLEQIGVSTKTSGDATGTLSSGASTAVSTLLSGVLAGVRELSSFFFFLTMVVLGTYFMIKDGPMMARWVEDHSGLPRDAARIISNQLASSMRGYFSGVTIVAAFGAAVVAVGSLIIGVPYVGAITLVTFIAGYIPFLGAWGAGLFTVLLALGAGGESAAIGMIVTQVLANGVLQQFIQPFAMGATLGIHPLVVLVVTIAGGALFGVVGLIVAAPLAAAAVGVSVDLKAARGQPEGAGPAPKAASG